MDFNQWWNNPEHAFNINCPSNIWIVQEAWNESRRQTAEEIIQFIMDQGLIECGKDNVYFVTQDDIEELREKFGLEV